MYRSTAADKSDLRRRERCCLYIQAVRDFALPYAKAFQLELDGPYPG